MVERVYIFVRLTLQSTVSKIRFNFLFSGTKFLFFWPYLVHICSVHSQEGPNFCLFRSTMHRFPDTIQLTVWLFLPYLAYVHCSDETFTCLHGIIYVYSTNRWFRLLRFGKRFVKLPYFPVNQDVPCLFGEKTRKNRSLERPFGWEIPNARYIDDDFMRLLHLTTSDMERFDTR